MNYEEYPGFYQTYIKRVPQGDPLALLERGKKEVLLTLAMVSEGKASEAYAPGKWTIKDLLQHLIDTERIFSFRALAIARGEKQSLLGYDENAYAEAASANDRKLKELLEEYKRLRESSVDLFKSFNQSMLQQRGRANEQEISVEQILNILIGHELHHLAILNERYL
jgi:uncharacterized damage-inducible protein DinB